LDVDFAPADMIKHGVKIYCSYGLDEQGQRNVGSERGIAFLAEDGSITGACEKIEKALNKVTGEFHHRSDIGSKALLEKKTQNVQSLRNTMVHIRCARENDFMNVYNFISGCHPLENYSEHFYKIMIRYFGDSCFILESQGEIRGFILGFFSQTQTLKTYFLWQIGIHPDAQGKGYGQRLLQHAEDTLLKMGCRRIELTIAPENKPSQRLFEKMGYANISKEVGKTIQIDGKHAVKDYYRPSGHFHVYEKILPPIYAKN
jgi:diaminobutyrate acetyltransferase